jgi:Holliday junction resolvase RusA-like endonuclease
MVQQDQLIKTRNVVIAEFFIPGTPVAKGRPKFFRRGNFVGTYTPKKTENFENNIFSYAASYARQNSVLPSEGPVSIDVKFFMPRPKSHSKRQREILWHTSRPDKDNLVKAVLDGINGVFFKDDSQVCKESSEKLYAAENQQPGIHVTIAAL